MTHISNDFGLLYINATRRRVGAVTKHATDLSQHEALKDAHVHEIALCVTSGAVRFGTHFRVFTPCSEYAVIPMLHGHTCPPPHTVRNVWRASPFDSGEPLGPPLGRLGRQGRPRTPERFLLATVWAANVA